MVPLERTVSKHFLVPKHEIVPKDKEEELLKRLGSTKKLLPRILASDSAVIEIGAERGDIIKITRDSQTAGKSVYYRAVY